MSTVNDDDLGQLLRELPRQEASSTFTKEVLSRLAEKNAENAKNARRATRKIAVGRLALAASVVVGLYLGADVVLDRVASLRAAQRLRALRSEYQSLQDELAKLRQLADDAQPVVDLGGTDDVDFVLDLRELGPPGLGTQPVSHSSGASPEANSRERP